METITFSAVFAEELIGYLQILAIRFTHAAETNNPIIDLSHEPEMQQIVALTGVFGKALSDLQKQQNPEYKASVEIWSPEAIAAHAELKRMAIERGMPPEMFIKLK